MDKRIIFSFFLIAVVAVAAFAGTLAFFSATQTIERAGFLVGTLDLDVRSGNVPLESFVLENFGADYEMNGKKRMDP